jgi:hypothetical protein
MRVQHLAIDGSQVILEASADLETGATATGWAIVPSLLRTHPFTVYPAGHSKVIEENVTASFPEVKILSQEEYSLKGGQLRIAEIELPSATGGVRQLSVGAWEGRRGCLTTSFTGLHRDQLIEAFDTLQFSEREQGLAIDSPVTIQPRVPEVIKEIPGVAVLGIRPAIASELELIPRSGGLATESGELFRIRESSRALMIVNDTVIARVNPLPDAETERVLAVVENIHIEWQPVRR